LGRYISAQIFYYCFLHTECSQILMFVCALILLCLVANNCDIFGIDTLILVYLTSLDG